MKTDGLKRFVKSLLWPAIFSCACMVLVFILPEQYLPSRVVTWKHKIIELQNDNNIQDATEATLETE